MPSQMWDFLQKVFHYLPSKIALVVGTIGICVWIGIFIFRAVKESVGLKKDFNDVRKTDLEIEQIEDAKTKNAALVQPATFQDVKQFDPKFGQIHRRSKLEDYKETLKSMREMALMFAPGILLLVIGAALVLIPLVISIIHRIFR